jgi:capsular polysaccharide biosynthesis protein
MEEEINLRKYIDVLLQHWLLIVSITLIAVLVAGLFSFLAVTRAYEAKAAVLITRTRAEIVFVPEYKTFLPTEDKDFRQALVGLVESSGVASAAIEELGDRLEPEEQSVTKMLDKVGMKTNGDLIEISVKTTDAEKAAAIANAWAESYESYINSLYSGILLTPEELQVQADAAREDYQVKQTTLEDFLGDNSIAELTDQIADRNLLIDIKSLRQQLESGAFSPASSAANSLSLLLLQTEAFTPLPAELQVSLEGLLAVASDTEEQLQDVDALISNLELRAEVSPGLSISELRQEILQLERNLEQESARKEELQQARDSAWQAYTTLDNKVIEAKVASQAQDVVVRVAALATVPGTPVPTHRITNIVIALVLGLIVGVFAAFGVEYFQKGKESPQPDEQRKV